MWIWRTYHIFFFFLFFGVFGITWRFIYPKLLFLKLFFRLSISILWFILNFLRFLLMGNLSISHSFFLLLMSMKDLFDIISLFVTIVTSSVSVILVNIGITFCKLCHFCFFRMYVLFAKFFFKLVYTLI